MSKIILRLSPTEKQAEESDGSNKRIKANARKKHDHKAGFYFDPPTCLQQSKSGCICIDNKDEFCAKYAISAVDNYEKNILSIQEDTNNGKNTSRNISAKG